MRPHILHIFEFVNKSTKHMKKYSTANQSFGYRHWCDFTFLLDGSGYHRAIRYLQTEMDNPGISRYITSNKWLWTRQRAPVRFQEWLCNGVGLNMTMDVMWNRLRSHWDDVRYASLHPNGFVDLLTHRFATMGFLLEDRPLLNVVTHMQQKISNGAVTCICMLTQDNVLLATSYLHRMRVC